ncbi:MAG: glycosyltransferase family 4 protein [Candidatus Taylorbacteria bacterium]|nr:glycosyltransferase family 4 protein [Candidatus Taylorbacteria bacterium]
MKLLIITQKVDKNDPILGFFHGWIIEFAKHFESIVVVCLEKGFAELPNNVKVLSLGKESGHSRMKYVRRFYRFIWKERQNYDAVFVHMNQEYVLLGAKIWRILGKKTFMWRNHQVGGFLTDLAVLFCNKVFCTSKQSYTAKFKKTVLMPVGINTDLFVRKPEIQRIPNSILFLGRMDPVKKPELLIEALKILNKEGIEFNVSFYGNPSSGNEQYYDTLKEKVTGSALNSKIRFYQGLSNSETVRIYNEHEIYVNVTGSGSFDKTIFEAMACEMLVVASNKGLIDVIDSEFIFEENNVEDLVLKLRKILSLDQNSKRQYGEKMRRIVVDRHSLRELANHLKEAML